MTNRGVAVLGLRLLALAVLVFWLLRLPEQYALLRERPGDGVLLGLLLAPLLLAGLLWSQVRWLADLILPQRTAQAGSQRLDSYQAQVIAFAAVGVLLLILSLPELIRVGFAVRQAYEPILGAGSVETALWVQLLTTLLQFALAVSLLLGGRGLAGGLIRLRRLGAPAARPVTDSRRG